MDKGPGMRHRPCRHSLVMLERGHLLGNEEKAPELSKTGLGLGPAAPAAVAAWRGWAVTRTRFLGFLAVPALRA